MEVEQAFGKVLREMRNKQSLSQEKLAHHCGLDRTYISLIERGKRNPTIGTIFALAPALNVKPSHLIRETEKLLGLEDV